MPRDVEVKIKMTEVPAVERTLRSARRLIERLTPPAPGSRSWWTWPSTRMWPATRVALAVLVLVAWVVADGELAAYLFGFAWALLVTVVADLIVGLYVQAGERRNALSHGRHPAATEKAQRLNLCAGTADPRKAGERVNVTWLPWWLRRCRCRSYHRRTGVHADVCPRARGC